jgi:hypothetical protein
MGGDRGLEKPAGGEHRTGNRTLFELVGLADIEHDHLTKPILEIIGLNFSDLQLGCGDEVAIVLRHGFIRLLLQGEW